MSGFCARREMPSLVSDALASRAGSAAVQPRAHKNFRLRRASKQPLSDVSRAGKQVCAGQKSVPPNSFCRRACIAPRGARHNAANLSRAELVL